MSNVENPPGITPTPLAEEPIPSNPLERDLEDERRLFAVIQEAAKRYQARLASAESAPPPGPEAS